MVMEGLNRGLGGTSRRRRLCEDLKEKTSELEDRESLCMTEKVVFFEFECMCDSEVVMIGVEGGLPGYEDEDLGIYYEI